MIEGRSSSLLLLVSIIEIEVRRLQSFDLYEVSTFFSFPLVSGDGKKCERLRETVEIQREQVVDKSLEKFK